METFSALGTVVLKFIPKWCGAWWRALLGDSGSSRGAPGAGDWGSRVSIGRLPTLGLSCTRRLAPARPGGTNCSGETSPGPGLTFSFAPPWAEPGAPRTACHRPVPTAGRELPPSAPPPTTTAGSRSSRCAFLCGLRGQPQPGGPGAAAQQPAGGDRLHGRPGERGSSGPAGARLQRSGGRCAQRIGVTGSRRPLLCRPSREGRLARRLRIPG